MRLRVGLCASGMGLSIPTSEYTQAANGVTSHLVTMLEEAMTDLVLNENREGIAVLSLTRREKLNALNYALIDRLLATLDDIEVDDRIRAVILTGAGERAFSAGADIEAVSGSVGLGAEIAPR